MKKLTEEQSQKILEENQEAVCEMCEDCILLCKSNTSTFQCEGSRCEEAAEMYLEGLEEETP